VNRVTPERAREILEAAGGVEILVVGDLMLDRYISGRVERISPEAPVPVVHVDDESHAVGGAGNVAANVVALGAGCSVVGLVGDDESGRQLRGDLEEVGVAVDGLVVDGERPTTVKIRVMSRHQQIVRVDREWDGDVGGDAEQRLVDAIRSLAERADGVAVEDYNKGVLVPAVIGAALGSDGSHELRSVVDPKRLRFWEYGHATVFKPNAKELADALAERLAPDDPAWMERVRQRVGCDHLLLTLGEEGVALQTAAGVHLRVPAVARSVYDVSGAGDTVTAVAAVTLAAGASVEEAAVLANHAAAVEVGKAGVATVRPEEILEQCAVYAART